jgi:KDO2-lipid IV(A) lauroyltransferase
LAKPTTPTFQHRLEYIGFRVVAGILNVLPLGVASAIMGVVWQGLARFNHRHATVQKHLREAFPEKAESEIRRITFRHWNNLGRTMAEGLCVGKMLRQTHRITLQSQDLIDRLAQSTKGAVFVSLHMGNWELLALPALENGLSMAGIYQRASNPLVDRYIRQVRQPLYPGGLHSKRNASMNGLIKWVRGGETVCMMGDLRQSGGIKVPFFGYQAPSTPFPAMIAEKLDVPLIAACCRRTTGCHFTIQAVEIPRGVGDSVEARIADGTTRIHRQFEEWIRETPDQWMWGHRRR